MRTLKSAVLCAILIHCLSTTAHAADCNEITNILSVADWHTLASGPGDAKTAPAKTLLSGFDQCRIFFRDPDFAYTYECSGPASTTQGDDNMAAVKAVASQWRSCFGGWSETSKSSGIPNVMNIDGVNFRKDNFNVFFRAKSWGVIQAQFP
jgi:hypothetical protein